MPKSRIQSNHIAQLGISLDKASMIYVNDSDTPTFREELTMSLDEIVQDGHHYIPVKRANMKSEKSGQRNILSK